MKISTSLARQLLVVLRERLQAANDLTLMMCTGEVPVDADAPLPPGALLGYFVAPGGNPLTLAAPTNNTVGIPKDITWTCNPVASGTATYFRLLNRYNDAGGQVSYETSPTPRLQGTVGPSGADLIMVDPVFVAGTPKEIKNFLFTLPLVS